MASILSRMAAPIRGRRAHGPAPDPVIPDPIAPTEDEFIEMTLQEHLEELRKRIVWSSLAILAGVVAGFFLAFTVIEKVAEQANVESGQLQIINPTEPFTVYFKVVLYIAVAIAMPILIYQFLMFVAPGLTRTERRYVYMSIPFVVIMFAIGVAFAFFVLVPRALDFLSSFGSSTFEWNPRAEDIISFYMRLMLGTGLIFELPIVMLVLSKIGVMTARRYRRAWKFAVIFSMVAAAIITPTPDPFNMMLVGIPTYMLYELGIILTWLFGRRR